MTGDEAPEIVNDVYNQLELIQRQHHIAAARDELKLASPDLLQLLAHVRRASSNAASIPPPVAADIAQLKQEIDARNLRNETYDGMCDLSAMVGTALPHLANKKYKITANAIISALVSGDTSYVKTAAEFVPDLRADTGKNLRSKFALLVLADTITDELMQLWNKMVIRK